MKIAIAIATAGRREGLSETISYLRRQTRTADALYICPAGDTDLDESCLAGFPSPAHVVRGARGLPAQRNAILRQMADEDIVVFFDDDFLPEATFIAEVESLYANNPDVLLATGHVVADGIKNKGISLDEAVSIIDALPPLPALDVKPSYSIYGCNMAVRIDVARKAGIEFDEVLPLYGWWEDVDFSRRLAHLGRIVNCNRMRGVHQGTKKGRTPGKRLGYSQVINLIYLNRKGSIDSQMAFKQISRNLAANLGRSFWPEPWVDRRGRLVGNLMALRDAIGGRVDPQHILKL
ncbi:MAG TPA: glycosyltransferase [Asticcacaulis sp.]|nr:glycosyltransferase [Asticcacaulis sp.]